MSSYSVQPGDTFTGIASKHRIKHWQDIFFARENAQLRQRIQRPERIRPGDQVFIPKMIDPAIRDKERQRLIAIIRQLNGEKQNIEQMFGKLTAENDAAARKLKTVANNVDTAATVATLLSGLIGMSLKAAEAMKLSGEALKKANREFLEEFVKSRAESARDLGFQVADAAIQEPDSVALMMGKSIAVAFISVTSPSFWAAGWNDIKNGRWRPTEWNPDALKAKAEEELMANKRAVLANIDRLIAKYNDAIAALR
jgi:hypothetical protein